MDNQQPEPLTSDELQQEISQLIERAGVTRSTSLVRRLMRTSVALGTDDLPRLDLKIAAAALEEMHRAFQIFVPYGDVPKVTVFGSARTKTFDPLYRAAHDVAKKLADQGWMVVTGAGPGIMEAAAQGAGPELSIGVSIRLPFEEAPNEFIQQDPKHVSMKYFFTRKLMLMKESKGFVCLPGGFGTMDEMFELLTLQQTGKAEPVPIVLLDRPGGTYWSGLRDYVTRELAGLGMITANDLDRILFTHSEEAAVQEILTFWHNYRSLRWVDDRLVFRLKHTPTPQEIASLNRRFTDLLESGEFTLSEPLPDEVRDDDDLESPRIVFVPKPRQVGSLHRIIRAINSFRSAGPVA
ncbi:MAG: TIGR00730 family Rossman fold protein [Canibacter sp.]